MKENWGIRAKLARYEKGKHATKQALDNRMAFSIKSFSTSDVILCILKQA